MRGTGECLDALHFHLIGGGHRVAAAPGAFRRAGHHLCTIDFHLRRIHTIHRRLADPPYRQSARASLVHDRRCGGGPNCFVRHAGVGAGQGWNRGIARMNEPSTAGQEGRLDSWKKIAAYLKRDVSIVQRWERREAMPVHRHLHDKQGSVYAFRSELDAWWGSRSARLAREDAAAETVTA